MAHKINRSRVKREMRERASSIAGFMMGQTEFGEIPKLKRDKAELLAAAIRKGLDLRAYAKGRSATFLSDRTIDLALQYGFEEWVKNSINGADSEDPFFTITDPISKRDGFGSVLRYYPNALIVQTRCDGKQRHGHFYGHVFITQDDAIKAGHTHRINCSSCGLVSKPLLSEVK